LFPLRWGAWHSSGSSKHLLRLGFKVFVLAAPAYVTEDTATCSSVSLSILILKEGQFLKKILPLLPKDGTMTHHNVRQEEHAWRQSEAKPKVSESNSRRHNNQTIKLLCNS
jgi:hypothetical protein